jgi:hypothetical protein
VNPEAENKCLKGEGKRCFVVKVLFYQWKANSQIGRDRKVGEMRRILSRGKSIFKGEVGR